MGARGRGAWHAQGLMLHMPGRWRFIFDLALDGRDGVGQRGGTPAISSGR